MRTGYSCQNNTPSRDCSAKWMRGGLAAGIVADQYGSRLVGAMLDLDGISVSVTTVVEAGLVAVMVVVMIVMLTVLVLWDDAGSRLRR